MIAADQVPSVDVRARRHRRRSSRRGWRKVKNGWRRTKLRSAIFTVLVIFGAVLGGYKVSMYVIRHEMPNTDEFRVGN
jgi:hypothetical protein